MSYTFIFVYLKFIFQFIFLIIKIMVNQYYKKINLHESQRRTKKLGRREYTYTLISSEKRVKYKNKYSIILLKKFK